MARELSEGRQLLERFTAATTAHRLASQRRKDSFTEMKRRRAARARRGHDGEPPRSAGDGGRE